MRTIAICNQKGGVGKSTITYHVGSTLAANGKKVLLVDVDPQGNLTFATTTEVDAESIGLADVLSARTPTTAAEVIVPTIFDGADLIPTTGEALAIVRDELVVAGAGRESRLRDALAAVASGYDICLIDCPPSIDQLTINALTAADKAVVVTHARMWSAQGLTHLLENLESVKAHYNPDLTVSGIVMNQVEPATTGARHWLTEVRAYAKSLGVPIIYPEIQKRVAIADSLEHGERLAGDLAKQFAILTRNMLTSN